MISDETRSPRARERATGGQVGNDNARKHGHYALARRLKNAGLKKNDGRSAIERIKRDWKDEIRSARGGELSPQSEVLLEVAACTWLLLSSVDDWLLNQGSLVNRRRRELLPVVQQRAALVRSLRDLLGDIGLSRVPAKRDSLAEVVARRYGPGRGGTPGDEQSHEAEPEESTEA